MTQVTRPPVRGKKILWGVCGIGLGHTNRQLPLIEHLCQSNKIVILAYGESLKTYQKLFTAKVNVTVLPVVVPFMVGSATGLDFSASAKLAANKALDLHTNLETLGKVQELIGVPDLVISDYEPVSAQYAYATGAPLVTINQQSKYLIGDFTEAIDGLSCRDEVARLHLFFPYAAARIAVSFFGVEKKANGEPDYQSPVQLYAPLIKDEIRRLKAQIDQSQSDAERPGAATARPSLLVYLSSNRELDQPLEEVLGELAKVKEADFDIFLPSAVNELNAPANVRLHKSGAASFLPALASASGIISTAGHSLLCEAMYLGIPCYVMALPVYEQAMNAQIIERHGFGMKRKAVKEADLRQFLAGLPAYRQAIARDDKVLLRGTSHESLIRYLEDSFLS
jgi:uncharacterized protein (TIGR00661 family)